VHTADEILQRKFYIESLSLLLFLDIVIPGVFVV